MASAESASYAMVECFKRRSAADEWVQAGGAEEAELTGQTALRLNHDIYAWRVPPGDRGWAPHRDRPRAWELAPPEAPPQNSPQAAAVARAESPRQQRLRTPSSFCT